MSPKVFLVQDIKYIAVIFLTMVGMFFLGRLTAPPASLPRSATVISPAPVILSSSAVEVVPDLEDIEFVRRWQRDEQSRVALSDEPVPTVGPSSLPLPSTPPVQRQQVIPRPQQMRPPPPTRSIVRPTPDHIVLEDDLAPIENPDRPRQP